MKEVVKVYLADVKLGMPTQAQKTIKRLAQKGITFEPDGLLTQLLNAVKLFYDFHERKDYSKKTSNKFTLAGNVGHLIMEQETTLAAKTERHAKKAKRPKPMTRKKKPRLGDDSDDSNT